MNLDCLRVVEMLTLMPWTKCNHYTMKKKRISPEKQDAKREKHAAVMRKFRASNRPEFTVEKYNKAKYLVKSWAWRLQRLSRALRWPYYKLSRVSGIKLEQITRIMMDPAARHNNVRIKWIDPPKPLMLRVKTIKKILDMEDIYKDVIKKYMAQHGVAYSKLVLPIAVRNPDNFRSLGVLEASSLAQDKKRKPKYKGVKTGLALNRFRLARLRIIAAVSHRWDISRPGSRIASENDKEVQSGRPNSATGEEEAVDRDLQAESEERSPATGQGQSERRKEV